MFVSNKIETVSITTTALQVPIPMIANSNNEGESIPRASHVALALDAVSKTVYYAWGRAATSADSSIPTNTSTITDHVIAIPAGKVYLSLLASTGTVAGTVQWGRPV